MSVGDPSFSENKALEIVERAYREILRRRPDPEGLAFYIKCLTIGGKDEEWLRKTLRISPEASSLRRRRNQTYSLLASAAILLLITAIIGRRYKSSLDQAEPWARWAYVLWVLLLLNGVICGLLLELLDPTDNPVSSLSYLKHFLSMRSGHDSWRPMTRAIEHLRQSREQSVYARLLFGDKVKFQYPPSALPIIDVAQQITQASWPRVWSWLNVFSWFSVLGVGTCTSHLLRMSIYRRRPLTSDNPGSWLSIMALGGLCLAHSLLFYPLTRSFHLGQVQTYLTLACALSLIAWGREDDISAGLLLGLASAIKPQYAIFLVWATLRMRWRFIAGFLASFGMLGIISSILYGSRHWLDYASAIAFLGRHGESFYANQSFNGLVHRLLFNGTNLYWPGSEYPPFNKIVLGVTMVSSFLLIAFSLIWNIFQRPSTTDFAGVMLSVTIASPIAWEHHYGIVLPILALVAPLAMNNRAFGRFTSLYLMVCLCLTSHIMHWTNVFASSHWNVLQSYLLFGGLMVLGCLYRTSYLEAKCFGISGSINE